MSFEQVKFSMRKPKTIQWFFFVNFSFARNSSCPILQILFILSKISPFTSI